MIIGQTVVGTGVYTSPWFPREGDSASFAIQVIGCSASGSMTVVVQTKNLDEIDVSNVSAGTFTTTAGATGVYPTTGGTLISALLTFVWVLEIGGRGYGVSLASASA